MTRKSDWNRYRPKQLSHATTRRPRMLTPVLKEDEVDIAKLNRIKAYIEKEAMRKEQDVMNGCAPISTPERHYPISFIAPLKPQGEE